MVDCSVEAMSQHQDQYYFAIIFVAAVADSVE